MKLTPKEIKEGNALIANAIGYTHYHKGVLIEEEYGGYEFKEVFSKIPIEVNEYPEDEQCYFKELPNPDYGNEKSERFNHNFEKLDWDIIHREEFVTDPKYHLDWNEFMHAWICFNEKNSPRETAWEGIGLRNRMKAAMVNGDLSEAFKVFVEAIKWHNVCLPKK